MQPICVQADTEAEAKELALAEAAEVPLTEIKVLFVI